MTDRDARLQAILDLAVDGLIIADEDGTITDINATAARLFGYGDDELIGRALEVLMPEPFRSRHGGYMQRYRETGEARVVGSEREVTGLRKDGTVFALRFRLSVFSIAGRRQFLATIREEQEREWQDIGNAGAARRLDDFARIASEWFWETDAENRIVFLSERYFHDTGESPQALLGRYPCEIGFAIEGPDVQDQVMQALRNHEILPSHIVQHTIAGGARR